MLKLTKSDMAARQFLSDGWFGQMSPSADDDNLRVVLVSARNPINIDAAARATEEYKILLYRTG